MMNDCIQVRPAQLSDISGMSLLLTQLFSIETDFAPDVEKQCRGLGLLLDAAGTLVLVAEVQGRVIGMVTVQTLVSTAEGSAVGLVEDLVVDQEYRGKGIGMLLLDRLQQWAQEQGLSRLQLAADQDNRAALKFYARNGWRQTRLALLRFGERAVI